MADFELEDNQGNRYRISTGAGPSFSHQENICSGSGLTADMLLSNVPDAALISAHNNFFFTVLNQLPNRPGGPREALSCALASSYLTIEKIGTALAITDDVPDPRNELRVKIQSALFAIISGERAEAAMHTRLLSEENTLAKSLIYTGAFMQGIGSSAWGMVVWMKEVSDVVNPFVKMQHHAKALQAAWESEDFSSTYAKTYVKGEKRELVEALGFDPTAITEQQIDEAMAMTSLVMDDPTISGMLYQFTKDYAEAQHAIEITNVIGSAVFEIILTFVMAAVTGGVGVVAAVGSKAHLIRKFQKVGDLLSDFAKATRKLKLQAKKRKTKGHTAKFSDMEADQVQAKKTDAHGAETGEPSKPAPKTDDITELEPGEKGSWNKELNGELKPNHKYKVGEYLYETDGQGRVSKASGKLDLNKRDRNTYQQGKAGKTDGIKDGLENDEGGHLIASIFNGPGEQVNYAAMDGNLNKGAWKRMENQWADAIKGDPPKTVEVEINTIYDGVSKRPEAFEVVYKIDGKMTEIAFENIPGG